MRKFLLRNFIITTVTINIFFVLKTIKADIWASLALSGLDPSLDTKEYEKVLCNIDGIRCRRVILLNCHRLDGKEEDCADWPERCTYLCGSCYENTELYGYTDSAGCYKICGDRCECLAKQGCYYASWSEKFPCYASSLYPSNPDDGIPKCPKAYIDNYRKCKFISDKYVHMQGGVCFQPEETESTNDCSTEILLALNLNGGDIEASSGIWYDSEVLRSGEEYRLSGKSDETIYKFEGDEEVEILEKDRVLYETWVSAVPTGGNGKRRCLVYEVPDVGKEFQYFGWVISFLEEKWRPGRTTYVTIKFGEVAFPFKIENFPFKMEGRTYVHELETIFEVLREKWTVELTLSGYQTTVYLEKSVGPMLISICSGQCSQEGNDPPFRVAAIVVKRYAEQGSCRSEDPVECVTQGDCIYNTYYKTCKYESNVYVTPGSSMYGFGYTPLRPQIIYRCLGGYSFYLFAYGRPWIKRLTNTDPVCDGIVEILARNFNGDQIEDPHEHLIYMSAKPEILEDEAELTTAVEGIDDLFIKISCKYHDLFPIVWDEGIREQEKGIYLTAIELQKRKPPGKEPECITYKSTINEKGYYQLKTKLMIPYMEKRNERLFDIKFNGIIAATTIDASLMGFEIKCRPFEVVLFFEVVDSDAEGIRILQIDGKSHSEIKDERMSLSFCNSPSEKLTKGAIINGFSLFKYTV